VIEAATIEAPANALGTLRELILVRLLPDAKSPPSPPAIRKALAPLTLRPPIAEEIAEALQSLRSAELLTPKGQRLTSAGKRRALAFLGVDELPDEIRWNTLVARYLVPKALGLSPGTPDTVKTVSDAGKLAALLLKRKYDLPIVSGSSLKDALEALVCQRLGYPDLRSMDDLYASVLSREIDSGDVLTRTRLLTVAPKVLLGTTRDGLDELRRSALTELFVAARPPDPVRPLEEFDREAFALTVLKAARHSPTGRFGDNKVFINHVWRQLRDEPRLAGLGLDGFKAKLVEANRERLLTLSRADLVQVMNPADVRESEVSYLNAVFHFVLLEGV